MSESQDFHRWLNGEIHVDGWKSQWRIEQEKRRGETVFRAAPVATPKPRARGVSKPQYNKQYMKERRAEAVKNGDCADCYHMKDREGRTNCQTCQSKRNARESKRHQEQKEIQRARVRKSLAKRRARMKEMGMCVDCSRAPRSEGHTLCMECRATRRKRDKNRRDHLKKVA